MSATRSSLRSRCEDRRIYEALVSGLTPVQVAGQFNRDVAQVLAAENREEERLAALSPAEEERERRRIETYVVFRAAMQHFQQSHRVPEETEEGSLVNGDPATHKVKKVVKKKRAVAYFLHVALKALAQMPEPEVGPGEADRLSPETKGKLRVLEFYETHERQLREAAQKHPELCEDYLHAKNELLCGGRLPKKIDFNDPQFDPYMPEEIRARIQANQKERQEGRK